jgi:hypothetical protein
MALHVKHMHLLLTMINKHLFTYFSLNYVQKLNFYYHCMGKTFPFPPTEILNIQELPYVT